MAFVLGPGEESVAEVVGTGSATEEFMDVWRAPAEPFAHQWEERFGVELVVPLMLSAFEQALSRAGIAAECRLAPRPGPARPKFAFFTQPATIADIRASVNVARSLILPGLSAPKDIPLSATKKSPTNRRGGNVAKRRVQRRSVETSWLGPSIDACAVSLCPLREGTLRISTSTVHSLL